PLAPRALRSQTTVRNPASFSAAASGAASAAVDSAPFTITIVRPSPAVVKERGTPSVEIVVVMSPYNHRPTADARGPLAAFSEAGMDPDRVWLYIQPIPFLEAPDVHERDPHRSADRV